MRRREGDGVRPPDVDGVAAGGSVVLVVGAGYAGVLAANRIAGRAPDGATVVLFDDRDELAHRVRLHEVATGVRTTRYPLDGLLHRRVRRIRARVERIDAAARAVEWTEEGEPRALRYDHLVYAAGSRLATPVPGAAERGGALAGVERALAFAERLRRLPGGASLVVVGGGLGGIEAAAEIAEAHPGLRVSLLGDEVAPAWPEPLRERARAELARLGVRVRTGVRVAALEAGALLLDGGERVAADEVVWMTGFLAASLAADSMLPVDPAGRLLVDESLRVPAHPEIVGCGDAARAPLACCGTGAAPLRMACATAMPMAAHAADVVLAALRNRPAPAFRYRHTVQCVSLGRRRGLLVFIDQDDRPTGRVVGGRAGALAKEVICRSVIAALHLERLVPGAFLWPGRRAGIRASATTAPPDRIPWWARPSLPRRVRPRRDFA